MATDRRPVGPDLAALGKAARGLSRILLLPVLRTSYVYVLLGCCVGVASASGVALILYGASNLRHDPWHREWLLWLLLAVALLLRLGRA